MTQKSKHWRIIIPMHGKIYQKCQERRIWAIKVISGGKTYETERKSLHDIIEELEQSEGVAGLKRLHRECVATPDLVARLDMTFSFV